LLKFFKKVLFPLSKVRPFRKDQEMAINDLQQHQRVEIINGAVLDNRERLSYQSYERAD